MSSSTKKQLRKEMKANAKAERQKQEQAEAKKLKIMTIVFVLVIVAVAACFIISNTVRTVNNNGVFEKNSVAATVGDEEINSVVMNYYFMDTVSMDYNEKSEIYGDYTSSYFSSMGLDLTKPLNEQVYNEETGETWADHYLHQAYESLKSDYALYALAQQDNFQLPEDVQANLDNMMTNLEFSAAFSGASSVDSYLRSVYGNGADEDNYKEYQTISATASAYYNAHADSLAYTDADYRAYENAENRYNKFSAYTFNSYYVNHTSFLTGGTKDEDGKTTYSEDEKDAARKAAEAAAMTLASTTNVEELDAEIGNLSYNKDLATKPTSTANTNVMHTSLHEEYAEWLSDKARVEGDVKYFPSTSKTTVDGQEKEVVNGYYVLMFKSRNDNLEKVDDVRHLLVNFEGGTTDDNGNTTYSDAEKATAKAAAEALLKQWKDGEATEESFITLVHDNTDDTASAETGGLYEDIHRDSNYVENFRAWAIDPARKVGDTGIVESPYGYHIMYYVGEGDLTYRDYMIKNELIAADMEKWHTGIIDGTTFVEGDTEYIKLDMIYQAA